MYHVTVESANSIRKKSEKSVDTVSIPWYNLTVGRNYDHQGVRFMETQIRQFVPGRVARRINRRLDKGETLDAILTDIAPEYNMPPGTIYDKLYRKRYLPMEKRLPIPEDAA